MEALVAQTYEVPGWGVGEVWARGRTVLVHTLPGDPEAGEMVTRGRRTPLHAPLPAGRSAGARASGTRASGTRASAAPPEGAWRPPEVTLPGAGRRDGDGFVADLCRRFALHLRGTRVEYDDVDLDLEGRTPFEHDLCSALRSVPWGDVVSYGELAALAGRPGAARAAGAFCASSDVALVIPCHRVVAADGIGGYGRSGVALKRRLLELEGVSV